jgi:hypothetical protein
MQQGKRAVAVGKEADDGIDVLDGGGGGRCDDRTVAERYALQQRPVGKGAGGNLDHVDSVVGDPLHRGFVEGGAHRGESMRAHSLDEQAELGVAEARFLETPDVLDVGAALRHRVDETFQVAVLQLEAKLEVVR